MAIRKVDEGAFNFAFLSRSLTQWPPLRLHNPLSVNNVISVHLKKRRQPVYFALGSRFIAALWGDNKKTISTRNKRLCKNSVHIGYNMQCTLITE